MSAINLNMLFQQYLPRYANVIRKDKPMTKEEFINELTRQYDCKLIHLNNLFLYAVRDSQFSTIQNKDGAAIFE